MCYVYGHCIRRKSTVSFYLLHKSKASSIPWISSSNTNPILLCLKNHCAKVSVLDVHVATRFLFDARIIALYIRHTYWANCLFIASWESVPIPTPDESVTSLLYRNKSKIFMRKKRANEKIDMRECIGAIVWSFVSSCPRHFEYTRSSSTTTFISFHDIVQSHWFEMERVPIHTTRWNMYFQSLFRCSATYQYIKHAVIKPMYAIFD